MSREIDRPDRLTYSVSDVDDRVKREILEAQGKKRQIPPGILEEIMKETSQRGVVIQIEDYGKGTKVSIYPPILFTKRQGIEASFKVRAAFEDKDQNGTLDMPSETREMLKNSVNICEKVLKDYKRRRK